MIKIKVWLSVTVRYIVCTNQASVTETVSPRPDRVKPQVKHCITKLNFKLCWTFNIKEGCLDFGVLHKCWGRDEQVAAGTKIKRSLRLRAFLLKDSKTVRPAGRKKRPVGRYLDKIIGTHQLIRQSVCWWAPSLCVVEIATLLSSPAVDPWCGIYVALCCHTHERLFTGSFRQRLFRCGLVMDAILKKKKIWRRVQVLEDVSFPFVNIVLLYLIVNIFNLWKLEKLAAKLACNLDNFYVETWSCCADTGQAPSSFSMGKYWLASPPLSIAHAIHRRVAMATWIEQNDFLQQSRLASSFLCD